MANASMAEEKGANFEGRSQTYLVKVDAELNAMVDFLDGFPHHQNMYQGSDSTGTYSTASNLRLSAWSESRVTSRFFFFVFTYVPRTMAVGLNPASVDTRKIIAREVFSFIKAEFKTHALPAFHKHLLPLRILAERK